MDSEPPSHDPQAAEFRRLFELHFDELYRFAYRYVRSSETAKDLVHEAFLRLWRQRGQVDMRSSTARSFLYSVVRHQALDHLRHRQVEDRWEAENATRSHGALSADPDEEFAANEMAATIRQAVEGLPPRQQQVLLLRWQQQASYHQIAQTLGISSKTVAVHIGRAMQRLREALAELICDDRTP